MGKIFGVLGVVGGFGDFASVGELVSRLGRLPSPVRDDTENLFVNCQEFLARGRKLNGEMA